MLEHCDFEMFFQSQPYRICGISWSHNQQRLAVATTDRTILLYDENGEKKDKFATKPADQLSSKESYSIRGIAFSPDSTKLAVAQSDNIVYVYKLGQTWSDKKVICNKFPQTTSVMGMVWLSIGPIVAGKYVYCLLIVLIYHSLNTVHQQPIYLNLTQ